MDSQLSNWDSGGVASRSGPSAALQQQVPDPDEIDDLLRLGLHRLPISQFPRLRSLATVLATYDGAAELDEGLDIVIAGLRSQLLR